jgi:hypothetical protein
MIVNDELKNKKEKVAIYLNVPATHLPGDNQENT